MKYFILILISLNISTAKANECRHLFRQNKTVTEIENISDVILNLWDLRSQMYSKDPQTARMAAILFREKHNELSQVISESEIHRMIRQIRSYTKSDAALRPEPTSELKIALDNLEAAQQFLKKYNADLNDGLYYAVILNKVEIVKALLFMGAEINPKNSSQSALFEAIKSNIEILKLFIDRGVDLNSTDASPIFAAIAHKELESLKILLDNGAKLDVVDIFGDTPLHKAAETSLEMAMLIHSKDPNLYLKRNSYEETVVHVAARYGNIEFVKLFIDKFDINDKDKEGNTILHFAAKSRIPKLIPFLIQNKADFNIKNNLNLYPLQDAIFYGNVDVVKAFIDAGVNIKEQNPILHHLNMPSVSRPMLELLLPLGININLQDSTGDTALHKAIRQQSLSTFQLIIKYKPDVNIRNHSGETPLALALGKNSEMADILRKLGAKE